MTFLNQTRRLPGRRTAAGLLSSGLTAGVSGSRVAAGVASALVVMLLSSCSSDSNYPFDQGVSNFNPTDGTIPFPNGLLFADSEDGTLNIPVADPTDLSNPQVALNALDGFSTTEAATTAFDQVLDAESLLIGESVRVFEVEADPMSLTPLSVVRELDATEVVATPAGDGTTLAIVPVRPLQESTSYMVIVTNGVRDAEKGQPIGRSPWFNIVAEQGDLLDPNGSTGALIPLSQLTNQLLNVANTQGIGRGSVVLAWNFKTQSITPVLQAVKNNAVATNIVAGPTGLDTSAIGGRGAADILAGTLDVPYYLDRPTPENPTAALSGFWTGAGGSNLTAFNPQPDLRSTQTIPLLMTVPNANAGVGEQPAEGWPVAIFQHGITRDRSDMLALADSLAAAGFAMAAIDIPMHGITDTSSPLYFPGGERTFDLDFQPNTDDGAPGPDGVIDGSGSYFYNLQNLLNTRDNFRQGVADLWTLSASVGSLQQINGSQKAFIGFSLGAIIGSTMVAFDDSFNSVTLASPGGGISRLFAASPAFGPQIVEGLAAANIDINSAQGQQFLSATQTMMDSADPINHATATAANGPIHMTQILPDQAVLGSVEQAPLAGTEPLARLMGLSVVNETASGGSSGWVRFLGGVHGSIIDPTADAGVTTELQTQIATFAATRGDTLQISDPSLLEAPAP